MEYDAFSCTTAPSELRNLFLSQGITCASYLGGNWAPRGYVRLPGLLEMTHPAHRPYKKRTTAQAELAPGQPGLCRGFKSPRSEPQSDRARACGRARVAQVVARRQATMGECAALGEQRPPFERGQALAVSQGEELRVIVTLVLQ